MEQMRIRSARRGKRKNGRHPAMLAVFLVRPTGFEPAAYRVGVIRPSNRKTLRRKDLVGVAQIFAILKKNLGILARQGF